MTWWGWMLFGLLVWALVILLIVVANHRFWTFVDPHPLDDEDAESVSALATENAAKITVTTNAAGNVGT